MQDMFIDLRDIIINIERVTYAKKVDRNQERSQYLELHAHNEIFYVWDPGDVNVVWNKLKQYKTKISP